MIVKENIEETLTALYDLIVLRGNPVQFRKCQEGAELYSGNCDAISVKGSNTTICFCNTDGCNGVSPTCTIPYSMLLLGIGAFSLIITNNKYILMA